MNDATLNLCIWKSSFNSLSETCQTVHAEQKYILNSTGFELVQHIQPKFTALIFANPYAENIFLTVKIDAQNYIRSLRDILMIFLDLVMNYIHKHKRIYSFKRSVLPCSHIGHNLLADFADKLRRDFNIIKIFDLLCNVTLAHSTSVEREDFLFHTVNITIIFADYFRFIFAVSVPRNFNIKLSHLCFYRLF